MNTARVTVLCFYFKNQSAILIRLKGISNAQYNDSLLTECMMGDEYRWSCFYVLLCRYEREDYHVASIVEIKKEDRWSSCSSDKRWKRR